MWTNPRLRSCYSLWRTSVRMCAGSRFPYFLFGFSIWHEIEHCHLSCQDSDSKCWLQAQRNELNAKVRMLREELQHLQEQCSYVGEVTNSLCMLSNYPCPGGEAHGQEEGAGEGSPWGKVCRRRRQEHWHQRRHPQLQVMLLVGNVCFLGKLSQILWQGGAEEWQLHLAQDLAKQGESKFILHFLLVSILFNFAYNSCRLSWNICTRWTPWWASWWWRRCQTPPTRWSAAWTSRSRRSKRFTFVVQSSEQSTFHKSAMPQLGYRAASETSWAVWRAWNRTAQGSPALWSPWHW